MLWGHLVWVSPFRVKYLEKILFLFFFSANKKKIYIYICIYIRVCRFSENFRKQLLSSEFINLGINYDHQKNLGPLVTFSEGAFSHS